MITVRGDGNDSLCWVESPKSKNSDNYSISISQIINNLKDTSNTYNYGIISQEDLDKITSLELVIGESKDLSITLENVSKNIKH